jgi:regulator of sirC expression with transglutaminase-like and TPR domain
MTLEKPYCCPPGVFDLMKAVAMANSLGHHDGLLQATFAASLLAEPGVRFDDYLFKIGELVEKVRGRLSRAQRTVPVLITRFQEAFQSEGFSDMYNRQDPRSYSMSSLLRIKRGTPTMSMLYRLVAMHVGLRVNGAAMPGYFICRVVDGEHVRLVAPAHKASKVDEEWVRAKFKELNPNSTWLDSFMQPLTNGDWIAQMLWDLGTCLHNQKNLGGAAGTLELKMVLKPDDHTLCLALSQTYIDMKEGHRAAELITGHLRENPECTMRYQFNQLLASIPD